MHICLVYLGWRGSGAPSFEMATHLARRAEVTAVLSDRLENLAMWRASGLPLLTVHTYRGAIEAILSWLNFPRFRRIAAQIRSRQPDVVLFPMFYTWNPFLQRYLRDTPTVVAVHDPLPHPGLTSRFYDFLQNRSMLQATRCYVLSEAFRPVLQKRGVSPERVDYVPHADLSYYRRFAPTTTLPEPDPDVPTLLFFGRITAYKGLEVLLQAYRQVRQHRRLRLLIVGDGDLQPYQGLLKGLPDVEVVNRWIEEPEIQAFFRRARMVVVPYTSASQSGVVAIAAGFGLPVVTTRTGGLSEQVRDGETGLLVSPGSVDELARAIEGLLDDPDRGRALGENLLKDYGATRNWDTAATNLYQICQKAIQDQPTTVH